MGPPLHRLAFRGDVEQETWRLSMEVWAVSPEGVFTVSRNSFLVLHLRAEGTGPHGWEQGPLQGTQLVSRVALHLGVCPLCLPSNICNPTQSPSGLSAAQQT